MLRHLIVCALAISQFGCAEHNFVPGSPMAKLFGYDRTHEEIAAEDCEVRLGLVPGTAEHARCTYQLSAARRESDAAYMRAMGNLSAVGGALLLQQQQPPIVMPMPAAVGGGSATGTAFLKDSYQQGFNKVCLYNRMDSPVAITVGSTELCPLALP